MDKLHSCFTLCLPVYRILYYYYLPKLAVRIILQLSLVKKKNACTIKSWLYKYELESFKVYYLTVILCNYQAVWEFYIPNVGLFCINRLGLAVGRT